MDYLAGRGLDGVSADGRDRNLKRSDLFVQKVEADLHDIGDVHRGGSGDRGESPVNGHEIGDGQDVRLLAVGDRSKALDVARVVIVADLHEVGLAVAACCHDDSFGPRHQCRQLFIDWPKGGCESAVVIQGQVAGKNQMSIDPGAGTIGHASHDGVVLVEPTRC